ncbi:MAG: tyrosine-type recombinase/integrase [Pseudomonadota bacterium]
MIQNRSSQLDPLDLDWRSNFKRLEGAYAPSTIRSYFSDVGAFVRWCEEQNKDPFPALPKSVCEFLVHQGSLFAPSTVQRRLYAIRKAHALMGLPDPTRDEDVNLALRRVRRAKSTRPKQAKGLTSEFLNALIDAQPNNPIGLRNKAMLSLGYELLARRSELVALLTDDVTIRPDRTMRVLIRRSKSDPFGQGRVAFTSCQTAQLISEWLAWRGPHIRPLFCQVYAGKALNRALGTTSVKDLIKRSAQAAGFDPWLVDQFSGHSLRVGAAQDLLCRGHNIAAIMRAGGWKSVGVLQRYLEEAEHNVWNH